MNHEHFYPFLKPIVESYDFDDRLDDDTWVFYDALVKGQRYAYVSINFASGVVDCWIDESSSDEQPEDKQLQLQISFV